MKSKVAIAVIAIVCLVGLVSCTPSLEYVKADAETYEILSPYTLEGIDASDESTSMKEALRLKVKTWELRIRHSGGFGGN